MAGCTRPGLLSSTYTVYEEPDADACGLFFGGNEEA